MSKKFYLYILWLILASLAFASTGGENANIIIGTAIAGIFMAVLYVIRKIPAFIVRIFPLPKFLKFTIVGWLAAMAFEIIYFPFSPLYEGVGFLEDLLITTPSYILASFVFYLVVSRYRFTITEAFFVGGASLFMTEIKFAALNPLVLLLTLPWGIIGHSHMAIPVMLMEKKLDEKQRRNSWIKYPLGFILPLIGALMPLIFFA